MDEIDFLADQAPASTDASATVIAPDGAIIYITTDTAATRLVSTGLFISMMIFCFCITLFKF